MGFDPVDRVLSGLATAPHRHLVSLRVRGTAADVRQLLPPALATVEAIDGDDDWVRVRIRAERLGWVPGVLAGLDRPFVIEGPGELRGLVRELADRLVAAAAGQASQP